MSSRNIEQVHFWGAMYLDFLGSVQIRPWFLEVYFLETPFQNSPEANAMLSGRYLEIKTLFMPFLQFTFFKLAEVIS